ncbi:MAG: polysaccharide biosynthesis/export family protein [Elusimicrobiota bacterium]
MITRASVYAASALLFCGCGTVPTTGPAPSSAAAADPGKAGPALQAAAVAAAMRQATTGGPDYRISATDLVSVTVYDNLQMNRKARVDAEGYISLPLVGAVKVGGKTLGEAQTLIEGKLSAFVVKPQVTLFIEEYGNKTFFVMGEVQKPGSYPIPTESRVTVLEAISTAGGFTTVAAPDRARVLRYVNGESVSYTVDVRTLTAEGQKGKDMVLEPNDVVFVPQSVF